MAERTRGIVRSALVGLLCLLVIGFASPAAAQSSSDGSIYSRFGVGELQSFSNAQGEALGHSNFAQHSLNYLNISNPGTWADQVLTRASAGFTYQNLRITDATQAESQLASGFLNGVQFGVPLLQERLGFALGFVPYSRVSYSVVNRGTIFPGGATADSVGYLVDYAGSGGLQQVVGGFGYRLNGNVSFGASLNGIFGIIENGRTTSFIESGQQVSYLQTAFATSTRLHGFTATLGTYVNASGLFADNDFIGAGMALTLPTSLSGRRVSTLGVQLDRDTLGTETSGTVELPWRLGFGVSYQPDNRWTLSAGGQFAPWTGFESTLSFPGYEPGDPAALSDRWQFGGGVEFLPAGSDLLAPYLSRVGYRIGMSYDQSYISPDAETDVRTIAATGGLSLPTMLSGTRLDLNLQVGTRGKTEGTLVRDVFYRLSVAVNVGERWFQTQRLR